MKEYLGDGVYAEFDIDARLVLTTSDGVNETNRIVFEPETMMALNNYICRAMDT